MSYCVNCGVELERSEQQCPLCGVEVINPKEPADQAARRPYSNKVAIIQSRVERRYAAFICTLFMALAVCVCLMADLVYAGGITWSGIVICSLVLLWVLVVLPFCYPMLHPALLISMDVCALLLFLFVVNMLDHSADWYQTLALPVAITLGVLALFDTLAWRSPKVKGWQRYGVVSASVGVLVMVLEALLDHFNEMAVSLEWSWFVSIPMLALTVLFFLLERKREVKEAIMKRLRV